MELINRYYKTRLQIFDLYGEVKAGEYHWYIASNCDLSPCESELYEVILSSLPNVLALYLGKAIDQCRVEFPFDRPEYADAVEQLFPYSLEFSCSQACIVIPIRLLSRTGLDPNQKAVDAGLDLCDLELKQLELLETFTQKVSAMIHGSERFDLNIASAASALNMSKSTLIRKLRDEQTSFKALVEEQKKRKASQLLRDKVLSLDEIAFRLGYEDTSNFGRSFKRWYGCSPSNFRAKTSAD